MGHMSNQPGNYYNGFPFCSGLVDEQVISLNEVRCGYAINSPVYLLCLTVSTSNHEASLETHSQRHPPKTCLKVKKDLHKAFFT